MKARGCMRMIKQSGVNGLVFRLPSVPKHSQVHQNSAECTPINAIGTVLVQLVGRMVQLVNQWCSWLKVDSGFVN